MITSIDHEDDDKNATIIKTEQRLLGKIRVTKTHPIYAHKDIHLLLRNPIPANPSTEC